MVPTPAGSVVSLFPRSVAVSGGGVEQALDRYHAARWLEGGWAVLDPEGGIIQVNESLALWLERPPEDLPGLSFWDILAARV